MATESDLMALDIKHNRRPTFENKFNIGQVGQIVTLLLSIGGVVIYQRTETEGIRRDAAVLKVQTESIASTVTEDKARALRENAEQKQALSQSLSEIKSDVKQIGQAVQTLTLQVQLSQQQPVRRP